MWSLLLMTGLALADEKEAWDTPDRDTLPEVPDERPDAVVGGREAEAGEWPDAAGIVFRDGGYSVVGCTGVLVHPRVVLTAEHCTDAWITHVVLDSTNWVKGGDLHKVRKVVPYPNGWRTYDIAVILLEEPVTDVAPRVIATDCIADDYVKDGADVVVVGFGSTDEWGEDWNVILNVGVTQIQDADCSSSSGCQDSVAPGGEIGAGGNEVDACYGDSGGPLYLPTPEGDFLIGLTSRAYDNVHVPCRDGGIYVRPDAVMDWIEQVSGETLPRPVCNVAAEVDAVRERVVPVGRVETFAIKYEDADSTGHRWEVETPPARGSVEVLDGGRIQYTAPDDVGADDFTLALIDEDAEYPAVPVLVDVPVSVVKRGFRPWRACGCDAGGGGAALGWTALLGVLAVRRRR